MPETRRAAKRRKVQESPLLGVVGSSVHLPHSVVNSIFEFCDFASLINVGSCSSALNRFIFVDNGCNSTNYWRILDFGQIKKEWSNRITDRELEALLDRTRANERCLSFRLTGCIRIRGYGLRALENTDTLREIDLRLVHPHQADKYEQVEVDLDQVFPILETMAPFRTRPTSTSLGLTLVHFHRDHPVEDNHFNQHRERVADWLRDYTQALMDRAIELELRCEYCRDLMSNHYEPEDLWWAVPAKFCCHCFRHSCQYGRCPMVLDCMKCGMTSCDPSGPNADRSCKRPHLVHACETCTISFCEDCNGDDVPKICGNDECAEFHCEGCWADAGDWCKKCCQFFCYKCQDGRGEHCSDYNCISFFCNTCREDGMKREKNTSALYCNECLTKYCKKSRRKTGSTNSMSILPTVLMLCCILQLVTAWSQNSGSRIRQLSPSSRFTDRISERSLFSSLTFDDPESIRNDAVTKQAAMKTAATVSKEFLAEAAKLDPVEFDKSRPSSLSRALQLVDITWNELLSPVGTSLWGASGSNIFATDWDRFWDTPIASNVTIAEQFTTYLERLGVTFVKFGQALSARPDIVPRSLAISLTKLQDRMDVTNSGGLDNVDATRVFLRNEFQRIRDENQESTNYAGGAQMLSRLSLNDDNELEDFLVTLSDDPVAAASIGVVYSARLPKTEEKVCIKIQRPDILQVVKQDAELLRVAAKILESIPSLPFLNKVLPQDPKQPGRLIQTDLSGAVEEFMSRIFEELDYRNECDNIDLFWSLYSHLRHGNAAVHHSGRFDASSSSQEHKNIQVVVPRVYRDLCTDKVLVMEWIDGTKLVDLQRQQQARMDLAQQSDAISVEQESTELTEMLDLIKQGIDCTLSQLLDTGILHADPHGGNLLKVNDALRDESSKPSSKEDTKNYRLGYVDFGLLSRVPPTVQEGLICAVSQLVFAGNVSAVADLFGELQLIPAHVLDDPEEREALAMELERALAQVLVYDGNGENDATAIPTLRFDKLLDVLSKLVPRFSFQLPPYFLNNARALSTLEGMAREMDPSFNVLQSVYPYAIQRLLANPTDSTVVDNTLNCLAESPQTGRLDVRKLKKLVDDASLYSGYSRRMVVRDILKTKNGKRLLVRLAREQTYGRGKRALLENRLLDRSSDLLRL